jgi:hypothetical protein
LRSIVKSIEVAGAGQRQLVFYPELLKTGLFNPDQSDWRYFNVFLKDGSWRVVKPEMGDPMLVREQMAVPPTLYSDAIAKSGPSSFKA